MEYAGIDGPMGFQKRISVFVWLQEWEEACSAVKINTLEMGLIIPYWLAVFSIDDLTNRLDAPLSGAPR